MGRSNASRRTAQVGVMMAATLCAAACSTATSSPGPIASATGAATTSAPGVGTTTSATPTASASTAPNATGWIVYQSFDGLVLVRPDGSDRQVLLSDPTLKAKHPDWSPDGRTVAFEVEEVSDRTGDLWVADSDGMHARKIFDCRHPCDGIQNPAWSPDGARIAYAWNEVAPSVKQEIHVLDVATGREVKAFTFPAYVGVIDPRWSPDGTRIAYTVQRFSGTPQAQVLDGAVGLLRVDGSPTNGHAITPWRILGSYPAWSPTGDRILFQAGDETPFDLTDAGSKGHTSDLWIVRPDGSGLRQLTHQGSTGPRLFTPDWGGGAHPIRVAVFAADGSSLYLGALDPDGSNLQLLKDPVSGAPLNGAHPRWTATGP